MRTATIPRPPAPCFGVHYSCGFTGPARPTTDEAADDIREHRCLGGARLALGAAAPDPTPPTPAPPLPKRPTNNGGKSTKKGGGKR
jgi:hypothetical protein